MSTTRNWKRVGRKGAIKIGSAIGEGSQSKIYEGHYEGKHVAVKSIFQDSSSDEVEILRKLDHPNILKIFFTDIGETNLYIVLELCDHTLKEYVENSGRKAPSLSAIRVLEQVTEGLYYLHNGQQYCTVHRDLKPSNILFQYVEREKIWRVKISDFGISKDFYEGKTSTMTRVRGTSGYIAPELLDPNKESGRIRKETDMFSLGVIFYYTLSEGKHPFSDDPDDVNVKVRECDPCLDKLCSEYVGVVETLILAMLHKDYTKRISVSEVKCHHIFWKAKKKLDFFQNTSNHMEDREKHQELIRKFESCREEITCSKSWKDVICNGNPELRRVIEKRSGWEKKTSLQDLLRQIRNWSSHFCDKNTTSELQTELGGKNEFPNGFVDFFTSHFPMLLPRSYDIMKAYKNENTFKEFYEVEESTDHHCVEEQPDGSLCAAPDAEPVDVEKSGEDEIMLSSDEGEIDALDSSTFEKLVLRGYQRELAEQALDGKNSLIIAPTGSGKTAVANEIIKNHLNSKKSESIIFLVSKTTLAKQQFDYFSRHLSEHLSMTDIVYLIGEITINTPVGAIIKRMKLIVLTPQILIDELKRPKSYISFADISMMIFDECHNATKNHPYKVLMDMMLDYKADHPQEDLIQVIGMTASPGVGRAKEREKVLENLITLLSNLDVKDCPSVVEKHVDELKRFQNEIEESYIRVEIEEDRFSRKIKMDMNMIEKKLTELGVFGGYGGCYPTAPPGNKDLQMYENWVVGLINHFKTERNDVSKETITFAHHLKMYHRLLYLKKHIPNAMEYMNELTDFEQEGEVGSFLENLNSELEKASVDTEVPMLKKLFSILKKEFSDNKESRCIIFVPRKLIARALVKCIRDDDALEHLQPKCVTGTSEHDKGGMTKTEQQNSIQAFREGKCKALIATSVAEEGLDIPACNLVIMYNYVTGEVGRIQRAGRGRAKNSRSILITPQDSEQIKQEIFNAAYADATDQALSDLKDLSQDQRIEKIEQIQKSDRMKRLHAVELNATRLDEASKWKILCGQCKAFITKPDELRTIKNQHKFVVDPEFATRVQKSQCTPQAIARGLPFMQTATFKCKDAKCNFHLGIEMQYKEKKYPTLNVKQLVFEDNKGGIKSSKKWSKCPFAIEDMDVDEDENQVDQNKLKEFALSQHAQVSKGFNADEILHDDASEILSIANSL